MSSQLPGEPLSQRWRKIVAECPQKAAIWASDGTVLQTVGQVEERAQFWQGKLWDLPSGSVVGVKIGNHPDWPAVFLALARQGHITLPLDSTLHPNVQGKVLALTGAMALIEQELAILSPAFRHVWNATVLLKMTSGSTGEPRLIRFTMPQLLADADQIVATMGLTANDLNYGVIPFSHSYGFSNLITPLLVHGVSLAAAQDIFPRAILQGLQQTRATVLPGIPLIYHSLLSLEDAVLPETLRLCISAGAPLPSATLLAFHQRFGHKIHSFYGASECGGICYDETMGADVAPGFAGLPMRGVTLEHAIAGRIRVASAAVGEGYFPAEQSADLSDGIFQPGDVLEKLSTGWRLLGRVSDFINIAGRKVNPAEVEAVLAQCSGVRQAVVFRVSSPTSGERAVAAIVGDADLKATGLLQHCRRHLAAWQVPETIWFAPRIPVNERGKISRELLAKQFEHETSKSAAK